MRPAFRRQAEIRSCLGRRLDRRHNRVRGCRRRRSRYRLRNCFGHIHDQIETGVRSTLRGRLLAAFLGLAPPQEPVSQAGQQQDDRPTSANERPRRASRSNCGTCHRCRERAGSGRRHGCRRRGDQLGGKRRSGRRRCCHGDPRSRCRRYARRWRCPCPRCCTRSRRRRRGGPRRHRSAGRCRSRARHRPDDGRRGGGAGNRRSLAWREAEGLEARNQVRCRRRRGRGSWRALCPYRRGQARQRQQWKRHCPHPASGKFGHQPHSAALARLG